MHMHVYQSHTEERQDLAWSCSLVLGKVGDTHIKNIKRNQYIGSFWVLQQSYHFSITSCLYHKLYYDSLR